MLSGILEKGEQTGKGEHPFSPENFELRYRDRPAASRDGDSQQDNAVPLINVEGPPRDTPGPTGEAGDQGGEATEPLAESPLVRHLREHSNYMAQGAGLFDVATWAAGVKIVVRLLGMWAFVLVPATLSLTLVSFLPDSIWDRSAPLKHYWSLALPLALSVLILLVFSLGVATGQWGKPGEKEGRTLLFFILAPVLWCGFVAAVYISIELTDWVDDTAASLAGVSGLSALALALVRQILTSSRAKQDAPATGSPGLVTTLRAAVLGWVIGVLGYCVLLTLTVVDFRLVDLAPLAVQLSLLVSLTIMVTVFLVADLRAMVMLRLLNWLSLRSLYQERLEGAYLQASQGSLKVDARDLKLADLQADRRKNGKPVGPLHIIGTALNTGGTKDISDLGRKSDAFFLSCLRSGSKLTGFAWTALAYPRLRLADAMTISGAAFSPNQGSYTTTTLAILMTLLNARLGHWAWNPEATNERRKLLEEFTVQYYVKEMFGAAHSRDSYVYLSDDGHFDNTGIYELLRRRCRYIIAVAGTGDSPDDPAFSALGELVRLARIDFGVNIDIDLSGLRPTPSSDRPHRHVAVGKVFYRRTEYDNSDKDRTGVLVYVKATVASHRETADLEHFKSWNRHSPTTQQQSRCSMRQHSSPTVSSATTAPRMCSWVSFSQWSLRR